METVKVNIYSFDELSDEAKERAHSDWQRDDTYNWDSEVRDTLKKFEESFGVRVRNWEFSPHSYSFHCDTGAIDDAVLALKGNRARAWFWNHAEDLLLSPCVKYYTYVDEKPIEAIGKDSVKYRSKIFKDRVYDGTCPLTGWCLDCDILDPIAYFCFGVRWDDKLKKRVSDRRTIAIDNCNTVKSILNDCCHSFFRALRRDWEYQDSMESFEEICEANGYRFTKDGDMWSGALEEAL